MDTPSQTIPIELSIIVLCYKAEYSIIHFVEQLISEIEQEEISNYELILVANFDANTKDLTPEVVRKMSESNPKIKTVAKEKKGRMGWDMRAGLDIAQGKFISIIDGDGQMPVSDIPVVYKIIKTGRYDLVKTFRAKRFDGWYRKYMSLVYNYLFKILFNVSFPVLDINSKPKIITADAYKKMHLISNDWFTDSEIMLEAHRLELRICQVSTVFYKNERRESFVAPATVFEFIFNLIYYRLKFYK